MGLTERHWFEDEEEARRWLEEGKEKKMVVYDAYYEAINSDTYEYPTECGESIGLYKSYESAFSSIQNFVKALKDFMPYETPVVPNDCVYTGRMTDEYDNDMVWHYRFYITKREVLD